MLKNSILKKKNSIKNNNSIVTVDPYTKTAYEFSDNTISTGNVSKFNTNYFYNSYIQTKDVISNIIDIENEVDDEDISDAIETKAYDELGLDGSVEYEIFHFESNSADSEYRVFNVICIDKERLTQIFGDLDGVKYLDYITVAPFIMKSLYTQNYLRSDKTDCFVYFHKSDAFVVFYKDGEYLFSKSIRYSLDNILDTFSKKLGKRVNVSEFNEILTKTGFHNTDSAYKKYLMQIFGEVFVYINDIIQYAKRAYGLENVVDQIYIGSDIGKINGIVEFGRNYINLPITSLEFVIGKNYSDIDINPLHTLMIINAKDYNDSGDDSLNLSIFKRPSPFNKRPSGKLTQIAATTIFLSLVYPAYQYIYSTQILDKEIQKLNTLNAGLSIKVGTMKKNLEIVNKEREEVDKKLSQKGIDLKFRTKLLTEIHNKKVSYPMKAKILVDLCQRINKYKSNLIRIENNSSNMIVTVKSDTDKFITELMKDISAENSYKVSTDLIKKDDNTSYYKSSIKVGLNGNI